jgi:predicted nucleic acid-binding protein
MAAYFLDSSSLVKRYAVEPASARVRGLVDPAAGHDLLLARITGVEVASALARHVPPLPPGDLVRVMPIFRLEFRTFFQVIPVDQALVNRAMTLAGLHRLRGYDAVQLAALVQLRRRFNRAGRPAPVLVSADAALNAAAVAESFAVEDPNLHP